MFVASVGNAVVFVPADNFVSVFVDKPLNVPSLAFHRQFLLIVVDRRMHATARVLID
ncbi:MAG TPA: hypothetical protein VG055_21060 [Planctomycetaceae bacterium]|nr:hypothetical protein [Planctomycetaceae bacterium]